MLQWMLLQHAMHMHPSAGSSAAALITQVSAPVSSYEGLVLSLIRSALAFVTCRHEIFSLMGAASVSQHPAQQCPASGAGRIEKSCGTQVHACACTGEYIQPEAVPYLAAFLTSGPFGQPCGWFSAMPGKPWHLQIELRPVRSLTELSSGSACHNHELHI